MRRSRGRAGALLLSQNARTCGKVRSHNTENKEQRRDKHIWGTQIMTPRQGQWRDKRGEQSREKGVEERTADRSEEREQRIEKRGERIIKGSS